MVMVSLCLHTQDQVKMDASILDGLIKHMLPEIYKQFMVGLNKLECRLFFIPNNLSVL